MERKKRFELSTLALARQCSTAELLPQDIIEIATPSPNLAFSSPRRGTQKRKLYHIWSGRRDSNSRPLPWQGNALPLSYFRMYSFSSFEPWAGRDSNPYDFSLAPKTSASTIPPPARRGGAPSRTRTLGPLIKSQLLCQLS